jgi:hypothetical integral membrane protein (TIGR02206 family)
MMGKYFQFHSDLVAFRTFSNEHLITIAIILVLGILLLIYWKKFQKTWIRNILIFLLLTADVSQHVWLIMEHAWSVKRDLPLQLSDLASILAVVMLLTKSKKLFQFMYFAGLSSSIQAILTPDLGNFSFPHFQYIEFFISHGGTVLACLFVAAAYQYTLTHRSLWVTVLIINVYAICVYVANTFLGSNYLYIMEKPKNASLLEYLGPWPWYLMAMELVMVFSFYLLYWIHRKAAKVIESRNLF